MIVTAPPEVSITHTDLRKEKCDRCPAQAYYAVVKGQAMLTFCGHDFARHEAALAAGGWKIIDNYTELLEAEAK